MLSAKILLEGLLFTLGFGALFLARPVQAAESPSPFSGPISVPRQEESPRIQNAPAYDTEKAKSYLAVLPEIRTMVDALRAGEELVYFGEASVSAEAMKNLWTAIQDLTREDHQVSLIMVDLDTRSGVCYGTEKPLCSQSTIKAIYVGSLLEQHPVALEENGQYMRDAIVSSSNEAYQALRGIYGNAPLISWCHDAGVDESMAEPYYPRDKTVKDMLKLWTRLYAFLNGDRDPTGFAAYYADSIASATGECLGDVYPVQTKAGWESGLSENEAYDPLAVPPSNYTDKDPLNDEGAINDTGIVYTEKGPYLFAIYSDWPFGVFPDYITPNPLPVLVKALHEVQKSLELP